MWAGVLEIIGQDFVSGWAADNGAGIAAHVYATLDGAVVGFARADIRRPDLENLAAKGELQAHAFLILFDRPLPQEALTRLEVRSLHADTPLERGGRIQADRSPGLQIFVLGSPRSGTSELASTLAGHFNLPWLGEGHSAPQFATAAAALGGDAASPNDLPRFMARQGYRNIAIEAVRRAYFFMHGSASFLDKTPGVDMIRAAPFLAEAFPDARFIYMQRNGISNVLSRMAKFGGPFHEHCADWAASVEAWHDVRFRLPNALAIRQETMLTQPAEVAFQLADSLGIWKPLNRWQTGWHLARWSERGRGLAAIRWRLRAGAVSSRRFSDTTANLR